ncbi:MAG: murein DD-endopeptidase MepM/ murein hydrolase activator NlpD [Cyclobacteriaceae bacterium]|jgi:murein DD-endopeptidase MepM/ murein hydrolase activator NlpD
MRKLIIVLLILGTSAIGQNDTPTDYFSNPLKIPLVLAGSFGELRSNHFHSGLDIKTQQREGIPIYAPADGYVKRIELAHYGYGKALYVQHPNGYITVYAHLKNYAGAIQEYVKKKQYEKEIYEIELFPSNTDLIVNKGDLIGYTGNTGSSGGPHLHYEIRDSSSRPMNPLLFGIEIPDTKNPLVNSVFVYPIGEDAQINTSQKPVKLRLTRQKDGSFKSENISAYGKIGFGISTDDQQNGASNKNGVYQIKTTFNGEESFDIRFEKFSFDETRYLNRFIDYGYYKKNKQQVQKLFREKNNPLSIIHSEIDNGYITIEEGFTSNYTIEVTDIKGNKSIVYVPIEGKKNTELLPEKNNETEDYIYGNEVTSITKGKFSIYIPANSLYEDTYLDIKVSGDTLMLHNDVIPIHKNITISVDASNYANEDKEKLFLGRLNYKGMPYYNTTYPNGDKLSTRTRTFGSYVLTSDTTAPTIKPSNFKPDTWISKNETLELKIKDDLSGISSYRATLNGNFILMEYNYKKDVLTYDFSDNLVVDTENNLKLIVIDNVGNSATFEATFFRKNT